VCLLPQHAQQAALRYALYYKHVSYLFVVNSLPLFLDSCVLQGHLPVVCQCGGVQGRLTGGNPPGEGEHNTHTDMWLLVTS
jgi:hypothetical protein